MKLLFDDIFIIKDNREIRVSISENFKCLSGLNLLNNFYIRENLRTKIFIRVIGKKIFLSNSLKQLQNSKNGSNEFNNEAILNYKICGFIPSPYTIFKDTFSLQYYSGIKIEKNYLVIEKFYPKKSKPFNNQNEFESYFENNIFVKNSKNMFLFFSGGADSLFIFYNLFKKTKNFKNIIVKMNGMEKEFEFAKKISEHYNIETLLYNDFDNDIEKNIISFIEDEIDLIQDPIVPIYKELVLQNTLYKNEMFFDGQGADSLFMGLPHNLLINIYNPYLAKIFILFRFFFNVSVIPNTYLKRLYYRAGKVLKSLSQNDWISCFLSSIEISKKNEVYSELYKTLSDNYSHFKCKHKSISFFFLVIILDAREMQKYRSLKKSDNICLPFLDKELIEKVFSTPTEFFIKKIYKKIPIYNFINKFQFKISYFKTSPFFVDYKIGNDKKNIYEYSLNKIIEIKK